MNTNHKKTAGLVGIGTFIFWVSGLSSSMEVTLVIPNGEFSSSTYSDGNNTTETLISTNNGDAPGSSIVTASWETLIDSSSFTLGTNYISITEDLDNYDIFALKIRGQSPTVSAGIDNIALAMDSAPIPEPSSPILCCLAGCITLLHRRSLTR